LLAIVKISQDPALEDGIKALTNPFFSGADNRRRRRESHRQPNIDSDDLDQSLCMAERDIRFVREVRPTTVGRMIRRVR